MIPGEEECGLHVASDLELCGVDLNDRIHVAMDRMKTEVNIEGNKNTMMTNLIDKVTAAPEEVVELPLKFFVFTSENLSDEWLRDLVKLRIEE